MDEQSRVASFVAENELEAPAAYRLLDAVSELGEVSKAVCTSTAYGDVPADVAVPEDELGDALFALLALCVELDVDAGTALETSLSKYEDRLAETGDAGSGE
jgi:NTP pyrophosphatase (non-canonical NTP hydrolase)